MTTKIIKQNLRDIAGQYGVDFFITGSPPALKSHITKYSGANEHEDVIQEVNRDPGGIYGYFLPCEERIIIYAHQYHSFKQIYTIFFHELGHAIQAKRYKSAISYDRAYKRNTFRMEAEAWGIGHKLAERHQFKNLSSIAYDCLMTYVPDIKIKIDGNYETSPSSI